MELIICKWKVFGFGFVLLCRIFEVYYLVQTKIVDENNYQPEELLDKLVEKNHMLKVNYPNGILLMSNKEKVKCRRVPAVLKFHIPNRHTHPEGYCHSMLMFLFFPFRNENELKEGRQSWHLLRKTCQSKCDCCCKRKESLGGAI